MRLDIALKERFGISRPKAKELIESGFVRLNGETVKKPAAEVSENDTVEYNDSPLLRYAGRGGLKLEKALDEFQLDVKGLVCLDIGASTGGFTDCLLQRGAAKVFAVDVGKDQLVPELKENERVVSMENTDIRTADVGTVDFVCMDVSFISVTKVLYRVKELLKDGGNAVILVKPQFEAGKKALNKKGIVKDIKEHKRVLAEIKAFAERLELYPVDVIVSPIKGGDGNTEYLMQLTKKS